MGNSRAALETLCWRNDFALPVYVSLLLQVKRYVGAWAAALAAQPVHRGQAVQGISSRIYIHALRVRQVARFSRDVFKGCTKLESFLTQKKDQFSGGKNTKFSIFCAKKFSSFVHSLIANRRPQRKFSFPQN